MSDLQKSYQEEMKAIARLEREISNNQREYHELLGELIHAQIELRLIVREIEKYTQEG